MSKTSAPILVEWDKRNLLCLWKKLEGSPSVTPTEEKILGEIATASGE